jgi:hypothetical protein
MHAVANTARSEIDAAAERALRASPYPAIRDLNVTASTDGIQVSGTIRSYYHKQLAQELLREVALSNGLRIHNSVNVLDETESR